jgi:hypothetical protein
LGRSNWRRRLSYILFQKDAKIISLSFKIVSPNIMMKLGKAKDPMGASTNVIETYHKM